MFNNFLSHRLVSTKAELRLDLINSPWIPCTIVDKLKEQVGIQFHIDPCLIVIIFEFTVYFLSFFLDTIKVLMF